MFLEVPQYVDVRRSLLPTLRKDKELMDVIPARETRETKGLRYDDDGEDDAFVLRLTKESQQASVARAWQSGRLGGSSFLRSWETRGPQSQPGPGVPLSIRPSEICPL